jgi:hypothetical protein
VTLWGLALTPTLSLWERKASPFLLMRGKVRMGVKGDFVVKRIPNFLCQRKLGDLASSDLIKAPDEALVEAGTEEEQRLLGWLAVEAGPVGLTLVIHQSLQIIRTDNHLTTLFM